MNGLTSIGSDVRILTFLAQGRVNTTRGDRDYEAYKRHALLENSVKLQVAQNNLTETYLREYFTPRNNELINPENLQLVYNMPAALPMFYYMDIWSALIQVTVHALTVRELPLAKINIKDTAVFTIIKNNLNNILAAIYESSDALLEEAGHISDGVDKVLKILLYVASGSLVTAICLIFPVATKVDKNKDELLRHFMLIDRDDVKKQLDKCR